MSARRATKSETAIASDEAQLRSLYTGEVLREKSLCPLVVVRCRGAGVHVGYLAEYEGQRVELIEGRRLWRWYGAYTLHEVATEGVSGAVRLSKPVACYSLPDVIEVLPVSEAARESLTTSRWAK
jgi:hypothetical protein